MYLAAEKAVMEGNQSYSTPDGMSYTRPDLRTIRAEIKSLRQEIAMQQNGGSYGTQQIVFGGRR